MDSSLIPNHSVRSHEGRSPTAELQRESDRLKLLLEITNTLVSNLELRDLLRAKSVSIRQGMHCDAVGVFLLDSEPSQFHLLALDFPEAKGSTKEDSKFPVERSVMGRVFKTGNGLQTSQPSLARLLNLESPIPPAHPTEFEGFPTREASHRK